MTEELIYASATALARAIRSKEVSFEKGLGGWQRPPL